MFTFLFSLDCRECDEEFTWGPVATAVEADGLPVIPYDMAAQTAFECTHCGARNYTGDFELLTDKEI